MNEGNKVEFDSRDEAIDEGYRSCKNAGRRPVSKGVIVVIIAQFYPLIWFFLWPIPCVILGFSERTMGMLFIVGLFVLAKIYNNIFYYVKIPYGKISYKKDTVQFSSYLKVLTPMKMCRLNTFKILGKRMRLYSKKNCMWIDLSRTWDDKAIQYYPGTKEFNTRDLNGACALFCMEDIPDCRYYIIRDDEGSFYITDIDHYPENEEKFTLVASMISKSIYTSDQLSELHRIRESFSEELLD